MEELALNGGKPVREKPIDYGGQWIFEDDIDRVVEVLRGPLITCGPKVREAETRLAEYVQARHSVVVSSGTAALHCACIAAGIEPGDEVITTPLTFAASANCVLFCGGRPVFADVEEDTYNIDVKDIDRKITSRTKAVIAVDFTGQAVKIEEIKNLCKEHGLIFIEDAAHAIGTKYNGKPVGSLADMTCFSFHPVKSITSGEGGAVTTNNEEYYKKLILCHAHGITKSEEYMEEAPHEGSWYYEQIMLGYNYRMTDFQAALLLNQLDKLKRFKERRKEIIKQYDCAFSDLPEVSLQAEIPENDSCRHLYILRLNEDKLKCNRRQFFDAMVAEGVVPQVHYIPVYWFPYYKKLGYKQGLCPVAEEIYKNIISIPLYPRMTDEDVEDVIETVNKVVSYYKK